MKVVALNESQSQAPWAVNFGDKSEVPEDNPKSIRFKRRYEIESQSEGIFGLKSSARSGWGEDSNQRKQKNYPEKVKEKRE